MRPTRASTDALTDAGSDENGPLPAGEFDNAAQFARITSSRWPTIEFVGVWDTVASVLVPRRDRWLYVVTMEELAFTLMNPSVKVFRQAMAIDERRRMFRLKPWDDPQEFQSNPFAPDTNKKPQDILQVWFAGMHADIGGGYKEAESQISQISAAVDDRPGRQVRPDREYEHGEPARLGPGAQEQYVQICRARSTRPTCTIR